MIKRKNDKGTGKVKKVNRRKGKERNEKKGGK